MLYDITLKVTPELTRTAQGNESSAFSGHLGTHFDVMDEEFPLEYSSRPGVVFDVSHVKDRDIELSDIDISLAGEGMFVAFYTGFIEEVGYGCMVYYKEHPQLSNSLLDELIRLKVSIIGIDCAGVRRGAEHSPADRRCAENGSFIIENLSSLKPLLGDEKAVLFIANTYPMNFTDMTGLPCRVIASK